MRRLNHAGQNRLLHYVIVGNYGYSRSGFRMRQCSIAKIYRVDNSLPLNHLSSAKVHCTKYISSNRTTDTRPFDLVQRQNGKHTVTKVF